MRWWAAHSAPFILRFFSFSGVCAGWWMVVGGGGGAALSGEKKNKV
jgi:hypothetical protein